MMQNAFAQALLDPTAPLPQGVIDPQGRPAPKRFSVYQNNVAASLTRVLEAAFPVLRKLVGDEFFTGMAGIFLRAHPPRQRLMMLYGAEMADFLAGFAPVAHLGYLPDIARLEQAIRSSYHAADSRPLPAETLAALPEATLLASRLRLAPSLRVIRSSWPIHAIWLANAKGGPVPQMVAQDVVILRAEFDPEPHVLPPHGGQFLQALLAGDRLIDALAMVGEDFDLTTILGLLLQGQAITGLDT